MSYKHKYYEPMDRMAQLFIDYPILERARISIWGNISLDADILNEILQGQYFNKYDKLSVSNIHKILDILEDKGLIHNE